MATLTPQTTSSAAAVTFTAATAGGDSVAVGNRSGVKLLVNNGSASSINVTLTATIACSQGVLHNLVQAVAAGAIEEIPIPSYCLDASGNCAVVYSAATSVTVAAISN